MDRDDVRRIVGGKLCVELVITRPFHRRHRDMDIRVVGVELVDQRGHDSTFADRFADVCIAAIFGIAGAKEPLDVQFHRLRRKGGMSSHQCHHRNGGAHQFHDP